MASGTAERRLAAVLSADVVGYSRLMAEDDVGTVQRITEYRELIGDRVREQRGRVVDSPGDNLLAEFPSALDATRCAIEIQRVLKTRNVDLPAERRMEFRIGVHLGDVIVAGERIYGDGVNIAARLEALAEAGTICISGAIHDQVERRLDLRCEYLGEKSVKNIRKPVRVYRLRVVEGREEPMEPSVPGPSDRPAVAVLPFENLSGDSAQEYVADGMTEDLITRLSRLGSVLHVVARTSAWAYKGRSIDVRQVGQELGVQYVIEGSVRRSGDRIRVSAQLIDAITGHHVCADQYDRLVEDLFDLQDEITGMITSSMSLDLLAAETTRARRAAPSSFEAWDLVARGRWHLERNTKTDNERARALFEKAIRLDPEFLFAYQLLAETHNMDIAYQWAESTERSIDELRRLADKCVELDPQSAPAHVILGMSRAHCGHIDEAIAAYERATRLDPWLVSAQLFLASTLAVAGRPEEAIERLQLVGRLNPRDPRNADLLEVLAAAHFSAGRYEDALRCAEDCLQQSPGRLSASALVVAGYAQSGRVDAAREMLSSMRKAVPLISELTVRQRLPFADPAFLERLIDGLRKAGLPEE